MNKPLALTLFFFLFFFFTFTYPLSARTIRCNPHDKKALLQIKDSSGKPIFEGIDKEGIDCCSWDVVFCDHNFRVLDFSLFWNDNYSGTFPAALSDLPYLRSITIRHAPYLTGTIPPSIVKLTNLNFLEIKNTSLSGPIPTFLSKIKNLVELDLSFNNFSGSIPSELSQLKNLTYLGLDRNKLTGTIPESFGYITGTNGLTDISVIQKIDLSHNHLTGTIPKSFGNLNFSTLDFSRNNLSGDASVLFGKKKRIQQLDLSRNNFTFDFSKVEIPDSLISLDLNHNKIFGSIPQQLTQVQSPLYFLNVSYNRLCGEIPQGGNLQSFNIYSYFHNRCLCGAPLPACTTQLPN